MMKTILKSIENTYSNTKYVNVVGIESDMAQFINNCRKSHIWFYKVCTFFVYKGVKYKIVFLQKKNQKAIKKLIAHKNLVLNASNPF